VVLTVITERSIDPRPVMCKARWVTDTLLRCSPGRFLSVGGSPRIAAMHRGRLYPVMRRVDLTLLRDYPKLLPDRWIWGGDDFTWTSDPSKARIGVPSTHAAQNPLGDRTTWSFPFASGTLIECLLEATYIILSDGINVRWYFKASDNSQPGYADMVVDGIACLDAYPLQMNTVGSEAIGDWVSHGGYVGGPHKFGNMDWHMIAKPW